MKIYLIRAYIKVMLPFLQSVAALLFALLAKDSCEELYFRLYHVIVNIYTIHLCLFNKTFFEISHGDKTIEKKMEKV